MIEHGAQVVKHDNTAAMAVRIVGMLLQKGTITLQMLDELEENNGKLIEISAGQQLSSHLTDSSRQMMVKFGELIREERNARDEEKAAMQETLREMSE